MLCIKELFFLFLYYNRLKWNRKNTVLLKASSLLQNRTCGLCGKFDGSILNDFETSDGSITDSVEGFVNSWTMEALGGKLQHNHLDDVIV